MVSMLGLGGSHIGQKNLSDDEAIELNVQFGFASLSNLDNAAALQVSVLGQA